ncbi:MAG: hypothetical protein CMLOHMNK_02125 [Steroidobacteraceae bacterium]|nr:hypothetical protein [Steroidobacteraceae bacterium]
MKERGQLIDFIRGEVVGPSRPVREAVTIEFIGQVFYDPVAKRTGALVWRPAPGEDLQEVLYYAGESPHRKYGAGLLHPLSEEQGEGADDAALQQTDHTGIDPERAAAASAEPEEVSDDSEARREDGEVLEADGVGGSDPTDEFEVTSPDVRRPSTIGMSFCVRFSPSGRVVVRLPRSRRFFWQSEGVAFPLNGRYERCKRAYRDDRGEIKEADAWRRLPAVPENAAVCFERAELRHEKVIAREVPGLSGCGLSLMVEVFPRRLRGEEDCWLLTVVLKNGTSVPPGTDAREAVLYQTFFEVEVEDGSLARYPESGRSFERLDKDEQSLALLYRESATWGIGHGCAAAWDADPDSTPKTVYADVMPAVELPSMTPDIEINGERVSLSMRSLASLPDSGEGSAWQSLEDLARGYGDWIQQRRGDVGGLSPGLAEVAGRHLDACDGCLSRIVAGIRLLRRDAAARRAFRLANLAMLLQQIGTKQLSRRKVEWNNEERRFTPAGEHDSPWKIYQQEREDKERIGSWRAFQIAFLLMSLEGVEGSSAADRETVDLIWFPTGGGKTEAYLGVAAFYMFHQRLIPAGGPGMKRDGTNVIMRYTLRMLTTQQFQRAASLICAMEYLRDCPPDGERGSIPGAAFSLGLWIGGEASPNKIADAQAELGRYRKGNVEGNPLVLTECPWCRTEIGRVEAKQPAGLAMRDQAWNRARTVGISDDPGEGPRLHCPDAGCHFGSEFIRLPVEVIDERIYRHPPSLVIATADKFAMLAYREKAGALFGRVRDGSQVRQERTPPGLIIQDELHLISGPLGTMYALYEGVIEKLCTQTDGGLVLRPKIIASTATIRGAADQVRALYARLDAAAGQGRMQLFPSPGLSMGDSFFGRYARDVETRALLDGRLYLGLHASNFGSVLTTQVRAFSSALFLPYSFSADRRDPWWTLLTFYNSIRELSGAKTLFDSDIRSRLKFLFNREGFDDKRRNLKSVQELTSRLSQAEIVAMMDELNVPVCSADAHSVVDACLASNIIEVGVDIERLSLMAVVGQPKSTATYIQVTGRVGRKWWERPGLILTVYNPNKSRDRSHFEQFSSYHRRLYERVEPTTATPFAVSTIQRGLAGVLIAWARQYSGAEVWNRGAYKAAVDSAYELLSDRCRAVQVPEDRQRSLNEIERVRDALLGKWGLNPQKWEEFPQDPEGEYLMLWPGQYTTGLQRRRGVVVPSSMRQVDRSAELNITQAYGSAPPAATP